MGSPKLYQVNSYNDLLWHTRRTYRSIAKVLKDGAELTSRQISEQSGVAYSSIHSVMADFKKLGMAHVCGWARINGDMGGTTAIYKRGAGEDAPRPANLTREERRKQERERRAKKRQVVKPWEGIAEALVPMRSEQEAYEVNRLYLNWISEGNYG